MGKAMLRLSKGDIHGSLVRCFQLMAGTVKAKSGEFFGGAQVNGRAACQLNMALASQVISFIEHRFSKDLVLYYQWIYEPVDNSEACYFLARHCWESSLDLVEGRRQGVRDSLASLRMIVPFEAKHRVFNGGKTCYSRSALSQILGVNQSNFTRVYGPIWSSMVDVLVGMGESGTKELGEYIDFLVCDELDELPLVDQDLVRAEAAGRKRDYVGEVKSVPAERVIFSGDGRVDASVVVDSEVTNEDVKEYLERSKKSEIVGGKKFKKAS